LSGIDTITNLEQRHYGAVKMIYEHGIATKNATFETLAPDWEEWDKKYLNACRFVAIENDIVTGWSALTAVSGRCVYAGVCEVSVYVHKDHQGKGAGRKLLNALISESERNNIWTLQAGIFPENKASIKLHLSLGFREVGRRERIGKMDGIWRDTILLERRSKIAGLS
jgi:L-amino acid N-acyltransferase YncA